ncbi:hypothetical protein, partial [uncultured Duncaniella sp.]
RAPRTRVPGALLLCAPGAAAGLPCHRLPLIPPPLSPGPPPTFRWLINTPLHFSPFILALIHPLHSPHIPPPPLPPLPSRFRPSLLRFRILFRTAAQPQPFQPQPFLVMGRTITIPPVRLRSSG